MWSFYYLQCTAYLMVPAAQVLRQLCSGRNCKMRIWHEVGLSLGPDQWVCHQVTTGLLGTYHTTHFSLLWVFQRGHIIFIFLSWSLNLFMKVIMCVICKKRYFLAPYSICLFVASVLSLLWLSGYCIKARLRSRCGRRIGEDGMYELHSALGAS